MIDCRSCGAPSADDRYFCASCGGRLASPEPLSAEARAAGIAALRAVVLDLVAARLAEQETPRHLADAEAGADAADSST